LLKIWDTIFFRSLITHHGIGVLNELVLGHIIDLFGLFEQVAQEVLQLIRLDVTRVVGVVFTPDLI